ncbi:MAG: twitching motility protein PilT [Myxococcales bacterium]|nr:twitching motility protein PilT [Myxococcales bacterium]
MTYLLDTDTCIFALKQHPRVLQRIVAEARSEVALSVITEAELRVGVAKSALPTRDLRLLEAFLAPFTVLGFVSADAVAYAHVRAKLERAGTPIGPTDTLIAAHAVARELTLVTNNEREFRRVSGLRVENWLS